MILQALCEYYDRKAALGEMPPYGREWKPIPYIVVINKEGDFIRLESTLEGEGKDQHPKQFMLSHSKGRSRQQKLDCRKQSMGSLRLCVRFSEENGF